MNTREFPRAPRSGHGQFETVIYQKRESREFVVKESGPRLAVTEPRGAEKSKGVFAAVGENSV